MKTEINEEMNLHKEWFQEAKEIKNIWQLWKFFRKIKSYKHDYGTIVNAVVSLALAGAWLMCHDKEQGGISGFQASFVMWGFIREWNFSSNKCGLGLRDYDKMLYPQYKNAFDKTIDKSIWESLQKQAKENLVDKDHAHDSVLNHWQSIVDGKIPFGYTIKKEH